MMGCFSRSKLQQPPAQYFDDMRPLLAISLFALATFAPKIYAQSQKLWHSDLEYVSIANCELAAYRKLGSPSLEKIKLNGVACRSRLISPNRQYGWDVTCESRNETGKLYIRTEAGRSPTYEFLPDGLGFSGGMPSPGGYSDGLMSQPQAERAAAAIAAAAAHCKARPRSFDKATVNFQQELSGMKLLEQRFSTEVPMHSYRIESNSNATRVSPPAVGNNRGGVTSIDDRSGGNYRITCNNGSSDLFDGRMSGNECIKWCSSDYTGAYLCSCSINTVAANYCR